jgi:co-chaperonin GroES (HSP10)
MSTPVIADLRPDRSRSYESPKPLLDRILVRRIAQADSSDGLMISGKYREKSRLGEVIGVGDGVVLGTSFVALTDLVNVGDRVIYGEFTAEAYDHSDPDIATIFIVRIQDIRTVEKLVRE